MRTKVLKRVATVVVALVVASGCGGSDTDDGGSSASDASSNPGSLAETTVANSSGGEIDDSYERGPVAVRVINLLDEAVDVYVRTDGLVTAYLVQPGLAPGEVSGTYNPPDMGRLIVTTAGAGDAECVATCPHILSEVATHPEEGTVRTLILAMDEGTLGALELWEYPDADRMGNANAMVPPDPSAGIVVVTGFAVDDADFGLRMAFANGAGCVEPFNASGILIGGNQTPAFTLPSSPVEVTIHDNNDRDCSGEPVGGPFTLEAAPGERTHLVLHGTLSALDAIVLPMLMA